MPIPVIDPESSVLSYPQHSTWEHLFSATESPYRFDITSGGFPTGMVFQPLIAITGANVGDLFSAVGHPFQNGHKIAFASLSSIVLGVTQVAGYFVVNAGADDFQVSTTYGGSPVTLSGDITSGFAFRAGYVTGTPVISGISKVRLTATNASGPSLEVLFTIGTEPGAATADAVSDLVWDLGTNLVSLQNTSVVQPATSATDPILYVKEGDDFLIRVRLLKAATFVALNAAVEGGGIKLVAKELEPDSVVFTTTEFDQLGSGSSQYFLIYGRFTGDALAGSLSNYEEDAGTFFDALAEIELIYENPTEMGDPVLIRTSRTFKMRIERDLAAN